MGSFCFPVEALIGRWSTLFGIKPISKSFLVIKDILDKENGQYAIKIPDELVDHNIATMASTLVENIIGARPNIDIVRAFSKNKWDLKGQVEIIAMAKGFISFKFSYQENLTKILCTGSWAIGKSTLAL